jgi:tetratricopeptide (TPR) repeat protein
MGLRRIRSVFLALSLLAPALSGQDWRGKGRVDGWVKDGSGQPVANATVELTREAGGKTSTKTNKKGYWALMGLIGGAWNVDVSAPGFETRKLSVTISETSRITPIEVQLEKAAAAAPEAGVATGGAGPDIIAAIEEGNRLLTEKKFAEARAQYEKAAVAVPDNAAITKGIAQTYHGEGNREKTIETLKKVVELDPADAQNKTLLASTLLEAGKLEEGKALLDSLPAGSIQDAGVYVNLGILFMNKSKADDARAYLTKAIELDPSQADMYYYRGLAAMQAKKNAEAKADFQKFLQMTPDAPEAKEVREMLQTLK